jgi:hypothetical protein
MTKGRKINFDTDRAIELYCSGMSVPDVSSAMGIARATMQQRLKLAGVLRSRTDGIREAIRRGKMGSGRKGRKFPMSDSTKAKMSAARLNWAKDNAKGTRTTSQGYVEHTIGKHKGRLVHVVIMEQSIGRNLSSDECVHHKNHIRTDNRFENLQLMKRTEHAALHAAENHHKRHRNSRGQYQ